MSNANGDTQKASRGDTDFAMDHENDFGAETSNGKAPEYAKAPRSAAAKDGDKAGGGIITVQPLRRSEMQPSYAQVSLATEFKPLSIGVAKF